MNKSILLIPINPKLFLGRINFKKYLQFKAMGRGS